VTHREVRWLTLARAAWSVLVLVTLVVFALAIPALYARRGAPSASIAAGLADLGIPAAWYTAYWTGLHVVFAAVCFATAAAIVRRRSNDPMALFVSLFLALLGGANAPLTEALVWRYPAAAIPVTLIFFLTAACPVLFLFVFPNGRLVPRWTHGPFLTWAAAFLVGLLLPRSSAGESPPLVAALLLLVAVASGMAAQVYRYARVSGPVQRRKARWVLFGVAVFIVGQTVGTLILEPSLPFGSSESAAVVRVMVSLVLVVMGAAAIPLSIGVAVMRHRLWDIDVVVNRTLVYGALTGCVVGIYVLVVGGLGALVHGISDPIVGLLATGLAAALFQPLRERLQRRVDRLLYGPKPDPYAVISHLDRRLGATLEDLQRSRERLVTAREEERRRLRRDLHDGLGPRLAGLTLRLETAREQLARDPSAQALLADLAERTREAIADIRDLVYELRPPALDDLGLVSALREQAAQYGPGGVGIAVEASDDQLRHLPAAVEVAAYRIVQEAMTNVVHHSGARRCTVHLALASGILCVEIEDDGRGVEPHARAGMGLASMRERAEELGGTWTIDRLAAGGTRVRALLPCRVPARADPPLREDVGARGTDV